MTAPAPFPPGSPLPPLPGDAEGRIIDADFVVFGAAMRDEPETGAIAGADASSRAAGGMGLLQPEAPAPAQPFRQRGGWTFWLCSLLLVGAAFWVSGGHAWMLRAGKSQAGESDAGLTLALLESGTEDAGREPVLHVEAEARNGDARARALPPLSILILTGKGVAMRYRVAAPPDGIAAGARQRFSTRLPVPQDGVRSVSVAFAQ